MTLDGRIINSILSPLIHFGFAKNYQKLSSVLVAYLTLWNFKML